MRALALERVQDSIYFEEGVKYVTYRDTEGHLTGGIGHLIVDGDGYTRVGQNISPEQVEEWYLEDAGEAVDAAIEQAIELGEYELDFIMALTHVNFQLGVNWPSKWKNTYKKLKDGKLKSAIIVFQGSLWNTQTPRRVENLIRALEIEIAENNQFEFQPTVAVATKTKEKTMGFIDKIREKVSGLKVYIMLGFAILVILAQFATGFDFGVPSFPPATTLGELAEQLYAFFVAGGFRAAISKAGDAQ